MQVFYPNLRLSVSHDEPKWCPDALCIPALSVCVNGCLTVSRLVVLVVLLTVSSKTSHLVPPPPHSI